MVGLFKISEAPLEEFQSAFTCAGTSLNVMKPLSLVRSEVAVGMLGVLDRSV
jgi:hypothetical protein